MVSWDEREFRLESPSEIEMKLLDWFFTPPEPRPSPVSSNPTDDKILRFISPCPACGKESVRYKDGHSYALLASEIANEESQHELKRFFELYRSRSWVDLNQIKRFDGGFNAALLYAVRCPSGVIVLLVRSPVELIEDDSLLDALVLDEGESTAIDNLLSLSRVCDFGRPLAPYRMTRRASSRGVFMRLTSGARKASPSFQ